MPRSDCLAVGDRVVVRVERRSSKLDPAAVDVRAEERGEGYRYWLQACGTVAAVHDDGSVSVRTETGELWTIDGPEFEARPLTWWEAIWARARFMSKTKRARSAGTIQSERRAGSAGGVGVSTGLGPREWLRS